MNIITIDFETYWDQEHTLSKMSAIEYVVHPKTQVISMAIKEGDAPTEVIFGEGAVAERLRQIDMSKAMLIGHNMSGFDALILTQRFGVNPRMWGCTAAMARPYHAKTTGSSLAKLVEYYGIGQKKAGILHSTKGKRLEDFTPDELRLMAEYNAADVEQCYKLFHVLKPKFTAKELLLIDMTTRMLVEPKFVVDRLLLETALAVERDHKRRAVLLVAKKLKEAGLASDNLQGCVALDELEEAVKKELASAQKFSALLELLGVEVPMKPSPTNPDKQTPALAKTDEEFQALLEHPNEIVSAAARARLAVKSTILETRIQAFLDTSALVNGKLPAPLKYCGADTTGRWSGESYNLQNLPRIAPGKPKTSDALRKSLRAPEGYKIVVADLSGIELRVNHFLWQVPSSMALYQQDPKADLYKAFASARYGVPPDQVTKEQRQLAKIAQLGLGFGAGWKTFQRVAKLQGDLALPDEEAQAVVADWRMQYQAIVNGWHMCGQALTNIYIGANVGIDPWGLLTTERDGIRLPSGRLIYYSDLRREFDENGAEQWVYGEGRHKTKIYGGKVDENCIAEGTLVLTGSGWKPIEAISTTDLVHDGVEFVRHSGVVFKSVQPCLVLDGVYMTPDHEVLTNDGWKEASQVQRPYRPNIWSTDCATPRNIGAGQVEMALFMRMRESSSENWNGCDERHKTRFGAKLWVHHKTVSSKSELNARNVQTSSLCCVEGYARQVLSSVTPRIQKLWRSWDNSMRAVAFVIRGVLGGHGEFVPAWPGAGSCGQRWAVLQRELSVGGSANQLDEQANNGSWSRYTKAKRDHRFEPVNVVLQAKSGMADRRTYSQPVTDKPVFDILNCGPRHRFVVKGDTGPMVVHNCVQALARDIIADHAIEFYKTTGLRPSLMVHDELVYVVPEADAQDALDTLQQIMRTPPKWWPELVTWSEGDVADTYGDAK